MDPGLEVEVLEDRRLAEVLATADRKGPPTLAELMGMTDEIGEAILAIAEGELRDGRVDAARTILEGQVAANPKDPAAWVLLSRVHRVLREPLAARFCAELAWKLEPGSPATRLVRAEGLLPFESERPAALELLQGLLGGGSPEAERAAALLAAIGG